MMGGRGTGGHRGRPYGVFNSPFWSQRDRRGSVAAAAIVSLMTEIAP